MHVLVATDGSPCAQIAIDLVRRIHWPDGTAIHVVRAEDRSVAVYVPSTVAVVADPVEREMALVDQLEKELKAVATSLVRPGITIESHVVIGRPATAIVETAETLRADLIVVGSRGRGTIGSMLLGSVSAEVADQAHCPVLVARTSSWQRAMLGADGSEYAARAQDVLEKWPIFEAMTVDVASIANTQPDVGELLALSYVPGSIDTAASRQEIVEAHEQVARDARDRLHAAGRRATTMVREGDPAAAMVSAAAERGTDVIVVGTHGRTGFRRALAGSVARNLLLHAPCSVLIVREIRTSEYNPYRG